MDTLLVNGHMLSMDVEGAVHQALLIRGDRILAVGDNQTLRAETGADIQILDLQGKTVIPV